MTGNHRMGHTKVRFIRTIKTGCAAIVVRDDGGAVIQIKPRRYIGHYQNLEMIPLWRKYKLAVENEPSSHRLQIEVQLSSEKVGHLFSALWWRSLDDMAASFARGGKWLFAFNIRELPDVREGELFNTYLDWDDKQRRYLLAKLGKFHRDSLNLLAPASVRSVAYDVVLAGSK